MNEPREPESDKSQTSRVRAQYQYRSCTVPIPIPISLGFVRLKETNSPSRDFYTGSRVCLDAYTITASSGKLASSVGKPESVRTQPAIVLSHYAFLLRSALASTSNLWLRDRGGRTPRSLPKLNHPVQSQNEQTPSYHIRTSPKREENSIVGECNAPETKRCAFRSPFVYWPFDLKRAPVWDDSSIVFTT